MGGVRAKKKLGQHFLRDEQIALDIVDAFLNHHKEGLAIEIGPGTGVLTKHFLAKDKLAFKAFDIDQESIDFLHKHFPDHKEQVKFEDFLVSNILKENQEVSIVGNFPYNISSQIFFKIYEAKEHVPLVVGMLQKEVAERICAKPNSKIYGILSVLLQAFYTTEYLFTVEPHVFDPPPKVRSAVIRLCRNENQELGCDPKMFKRTVKAGFQQRRKTLRNALKGFNLSVELTEDEVFNKRAEQLSVLDFIELTKKISADGGSNSI